MSLDRIVNIQITRGSRTVSRPGFGTLMILGQHSVFAERINYYASLEEVTDAGFTTSDAEYDAAAAAFGQELKPTRIAIGRRTASVAQVVTFTPAVANSALYTVTINGTLHSYTSDVDATDAEIVAGLIAAINGGAQAAKVTASGTTTLIVTSDAAGEAFTFANSVNMPGVLSTPNNGIQEDLIAISAESDDWYALALTSRTALDIRLAAAYIQTQKKLFLACSADSDVITSATTDIASVLSAASYTRTAYMYSTDQANYPECAWGGLVLPRDPGSETWKFKTLSGITPDALGGSAITFLKQKNANWYDLVGGVAITEDGKVSGDEWIDVIRFIDWLEANMQADVYSVLVANPKIPYTDGGVARIEAAIRGRLIAGVRVGGLAPSPEFTVSVPKVADVLEADRADRLLPDVRFAATLAGAIHETQIRGVVSV